jgi:hypothetical protein
MYVLDNSSLPKYYMVLSLTIYMWAIVNHSPDSKTLEPWAKATNLKFIKKFSFKY